MRVGLVDIDSKIPNLALMKLSSFHKSLGDQVELIGPLFAKQYDAVYASKIFSWSENPILPPLTPIGGPGVGKYPVLHERANNTCPDYSLYGIDYSMGYLTRGCPRSCPDCIVPDIEGGIRPEHDIEVFLRHDKAVLLDNNVLACEWGIRQIEKIIHLGVKVDFNQGIDARLIDDNIARLLAKVRWLEPLRLACDHVGMIESVNRAVQKLRGAGVTPARYNCYVLVKDIPTAIARVEFLRAINVDPFAQPYRDRNGTEPPIEQQRFARWVNHKATFKTVRWQDYAA